MILQCYIVLNFNVTSKLRRIAKKSYFILLGAGTGISGSSPQGSANSVAGENVSHHQARLQAAAAAAAIYERSYVYPSANAVVWYAP